MKERRVDVLVIGAGVVGLSAAYFEALHAGWSAASRQAQGVE